MRLFTFVLAIFLGGILCCSHPKQKNQVPVISKEEFVELYTRLLVLQRRTLPSEKRDSLTVRLFRKYHLSQQKFLDYENYFKTEYTEWLKILDEVDKRIQELAEEEDESDSS